MPGKTKEITEAVNEIDMTTEKIYRFERSCIFHGMYRAIGEIIHTSYEPNQHMKEITAEEERSSAINESGILPDPSERVKLRKRIDEIERQKKILM